VGAGSLTKPRTNHHSGYYNLSSLTPGNDEEPKEERDERDDRIFLSTPKEREERDDRIFMY